jgi:subtilase family serine protease
MTGLTLNFKPSPVQQADLQRLLEDQQNLTSAHYHQWLTPEEFGNRYGLIQNDYDQVSAWLRSEGFTLSPPTRARRWITFRGTAAHGRENVLDFHSSLPGKW